MVKIFNKAIYNILGSHRFAEGGTMNADETDRPISQSKREVRGVNEFNTGGSHEENPYGGIPQGVAPDGAPNLVEQGEVKLSDIIGMDNQYILSNRLIIDAEHAQQFNIPESVVGMTYAAAFKKLYQPLKERSGNTEVKNEIAHLANAFMQAQDSVKAEQEAQQASAIMQNLSPEERQQMMQMAAEQQGQPSPEQQQMMQHQMQQQMMAQQQGQMAQDPSMMGGGQQMPPEAMMGQGGQPSPEEMAMMQQQDPSMMGEQQPMMARGGRMYNRFNNGGNMKINKNMFGGLFSHKFAMGGAPFTSNQWANLTVGVRTAKEREEEQARMDAERRRRDAELGIDTSGYYPEFDGDYRYGVEEMTGQDGKLYVRRNGGPWVLAKIVGDDFDFSQKGDLFKSQGSHYVPRDFLFYEGENAPHGEGFLKAVNSTGTGNDRRGSVSMQDAAVLRAYVKHRPEGGFPDKYDYNSKGERVRYDRRAALENAYNSWDRDSRSQPGNQADYPHAANEDTENNRASNIQTSGASLKPASNKSSDAKTSIGGKSTDELARLVIRGKLGSGKARKEALGDRYAEVQKRVNELMSGSGKKAKVKDERGGTKEIEVPDWVRRSDEVNLQMSPIESRIPKSKRDISASGERPQKLPSEDELYDELSWTRHLDDIPGEFDNDGGLSFDEIVNRARKANLRR